MIDKYHLFKTTFVAPVEPRMVAEFYSVFQKRIVSGETRHLTEHATTLDTVAFLSMQDYSRQVKFGYIERVHYDKLLDFEPPFASTVWKGVDGLTSKLSSEESEKAKRLVGEFYGRLLVLQPSLQKQTKKSNPKLPPQDLSRKRVELYGTDRPGRRF